jgi:hypothetical protein
MANIDLVIVSALITNINKNRNTTDYINYGKHLFNNAISQVLFLEKAVFFQYVDTLIHIDGYGELEYNQFVYETKVYEYIKYHTKIFVFFEKADIYLYNYQHTLTPFELITDNPDKDTLEYMFIQCHKTEWVKMATQLFGGNTAHEYMWIDFGIYHMFKEEKELFLEAIQNLYNRVIHRTNDKIRAASCWSPEMYDIYSATVYTKITWLFAGSVFGGSTENVVRFADRMKQKCLQIIQEHKRLMWEVNVWALLYKETPDFFDLYNCGHDSTIINNYS